MSEEKTESEQRYSGKPDAKRNAQKKDKSLKTKDKRLRTKDKRLRTKDKSLKTKG